MKKEFVCKQCGKIFPNNTGENKFCSTKCKYQGQVGVVRKPPIEFICQYCGRTFSRPISKSSKYQVKRFCSPACRNKARMLKPSICPICGNKFTPHAINGKDKPRKQYCSKPCADKAAIGRPSPKKGTGKGIHRKGVSIRKMTKEEQYARVSKFMTQNNPMKNPETAKKVGRSYSIRYNTEPDLRERTLLGKAQSNKRSGTKPELKCKQILENIGIPFEYQFVIKPKFIVDFCIDKIIIQIDGEYWHGHPRFEPLTSRQLSQRKRDIAQDKYLTKCGYKIFRIWESELSESRIKSIFSS